MEGWGPGPGSQTHSELLWKESLPLIPLQSHSALGLSIAKTYVAQIPSAALILEY